MMHDPVVSADSRALIRATEHFLATHQWRLLMASTAPKAVGCGLVYELGGQLNLPGTDICIADQRGLGVSEPHYHPDPDLELYVVLEGAAELRVGDRVVQLTAGDGYVIPPETVHYTVPSSDCILAASNLPAFRPERYVPVTQDDRARGYRHSDYKQLAAKHGTMTA